MAEKRKCRWPGCTVMVRPNLYACKRHWYSLPRTLRDAIWEAYQPGQENDLAKVSDAWVAADEAARRWAAEREGMELQPKPAEGQGRLF
jgi:hypothetical protein